MNITAVSTVNNADHVTVADLRAQLDATAAIALHEATNAPQNGTEPFQWAPPDVGTWSLNPDMGEAAVFLYVPVTAFEPLEQDWDHALRLPSTRRYIDWFRAGHEPPPVFLLRNDRGHLRSCNRRRWLAARAAGIERLPVWYGGPGHADHPARGCWYLPEHSQLTRNQYRRIVEAGFDKESYFTRDELQAIETSLQIAP